MPQKSPVYAVTRIRVHEKDMVKPERTARMAEASPAEVMRALGDIGYGGTSDPQLSDGDRMIAKELWAREGEKREALLSLMIRENVKGGETLRPAKPDRARLASLIEKQNPSLPRPVELGEDIEAGGGFRLLGCGYETDCSFEAMLRDFRERRESEAARVLFE